MINKVHHDISHFNILHHCWQNSVNYTVSYTHLDVYKRQIRSNKLLGEPVLQIIETRNVNNVQARVFELIVPLKLEPGSDAGGGKT